MQLKLDKRHRASFGLRETLLPVRLKPSLDWLLVFVPIAVALRFWPGEVSPTALFFCSSLGIIPLARWIGYATEALAARVGEGIGGLLNATFGNAAELIIALLAMAHGLTGVVKASITGSIIGNVLLVFGLSVLCGGLKHREQHFNRTAARTSSVSLTLAAIALVIPTIFHVAARDHPNGWTPRLEQRLSLAIAIILFLTYACVLIFTLKTHRQLFMGTSGSRNAPAWSRRRAVVILLVSTALVAGLSEFLVGSINGARTAVGLTEIFVGVIIVAIIGNAAEHSSAVVAAFKNKMDLSISIANGSSLQIALFVAPLLVFVSYAFGRPMDLEFSLPETVAVVVAVYIFFQISGDGETNWIEGVQLLSVYVVLAILFFYLPAMEPVP
jgi:Ca2+:H+ antiporter